MRDFKETRVKDSLCEEEYQEVSPPFCIRGLKKGKIQEISMCASTPIIEEKTGNTCATSPHPCAPYRPMCATPLHLCATPLPGLCTFPCPGATPGARVSALTKIPALLPRERSHPLSGGKSRIPSPCKGPSHCHFAGRAGSPPRVYRNYPFRLSLSLAREAKRTVSPYPRRVPAAARVPFGKRPGKRPGGKRLGWEARKGARRRRPGRRLFLDRDAKGGDSESDSESGSECDSESDSERDWRSEDTV